MLGATSLRSNTSYYTAVPKNFGKTAKPKNNGASNIATGVGAMAATVVGAYMFKGKLAQIFSLANMQKLGATVLNFVKDMKFVKPVVDFCSKVLASIKNFKLGNAVKDVIAKLGESVKNGHFFEKAKGLGSTVMEKTIAAFDYLKGKVLKH